ncbi:hypothetical protein [Brevibacillus choshinensis]|uniref:hypothetical protein n=1 Tax=Brevibacillus choshinensis TaxID=54911 RepID=UPI002E1B4C6A|nr:hypothetical protein [Brevibacillus choshinensis]
MDLCDAVIYSKQRANLKALYLPTVWLAIAPIRAVISALSAKKTALLPTFWQEEGFTLWLRYY